MHFEIMENYPNTVNNKTLMAKYLTPELYEQYWNIETQSGFSFDHLLQSGIDVPQFPNCGFIAGDEECYETFKGLTDPILTEKHNGFVRGIHYQATCLDPSQLSKRCSMFAPNYIESVTFTAGRSIHGYRFLSACNRAERREIERKFRSVFNRISTQNDVDFSGEYHPIGQIKYEVIQNFPLIHQHTGWRNPQLQSIPPLELPVIGLMRAECSSAVVRGFRICQQGQPFTLVLPRE